MVLIEKAKSVDYLLTSGGSRTVIVENNTENYNKIIIIKSISHWSRENNGNQWVHRVFVEDNTGTVIDNIINGRLNYANFPLNYRIVLKKDYKLKVFIEQGASAINNVCMTYNIIEEQ